MNTLIRELKPNEVFVFGSNMNGYHAGGAARQAKESFGAIEGEWLGWHGQSYAIPTLDKKMQQVSLADIQKYLYELVEVAENSLDNVFLLTPIGTGIAGYSVEDIKGILPKFPHNVRLVGNWNY